MRRNRPMIALLIVLAMVTVVGHAQSDRAGESNVDERLVSFAGRLRFGLSIATFAVYAPTVGDLHLHAQQLVNLLEGSEGRHFVRPAEPQAPVRGLRSDVADLPVWLGEAAVEPEVRVRITAATKNVNAYLEMALDAALAGLKQRRLDRAVDEMLRAYAFLAAAYERPAEAPYVPGLWTILRFFGLTESERDGA